MTYEHKQELRVVEVSYQNAKLNEHKLEARRYRKDKHDPNIHLKRRNHPRFCHG